MFFVGIMDGQKWRHQPISAFFDVNAVLSNISVGLKAIKANIMLQG